MFDKQAYWKRRKQGLRGQEELPEPKLIKTSNVMLGFDKGGNPVARNNRDRHRKIVDRTFTKKGYQAYKQKDGSFTTRKLRQA